MHSGIGINVYLWQGDFPLLQEGDWVVVRGLLKSFRGEMELQMDAVGQIWRIGAGQALAPLPVTVAEIGERLEGRLVTFSGVVSGYQGDSILLSDPHDLLAAPVRVTVRSSLGWQRPYVKEGQVWQATGVVSQFAREAPWNGGYRVLVRYQGVDLVRVR
jgi:DNA/RNA endonuclease YhcR with UshA esterase domain